MKHAPSTLTVKLITDDLPDSTKRKDEHHQYFLDKKELHIYLGPKKNLTLGKLRERISSVNWKDLNEKNAEIFIGNLNAEEIKAAYEVIFLKSYIFNQYKTKDKQTNIKNIIIKDLKKNTFDKDGVDHIINAIKFCRDIISSNASDINPGQMQRLAEEIANTCKHMQVKTIDAKQAKQLGMGCLLAVGSESLQNSEKDFHPRLVVLEYSPFNTKTKKKSNLVLVGKGITFDTGGLCLKPAEYIIDMKSDMTGAATVLSVFKALASLSKLPTKKTSKMNYGTTKFSKITGIMALAENAFGGASYRPGDILTAMNGKTIQVVDTDAEGRLVLADALSYASTLGGHAQIIDFATLTGSIVSALGEAAAGAMTNDNLFLKDLQKSFEQEGEKIWQMPIFEEYKTSLKSDIADLAHCGKRPDASVAALFLKEFVGEVSHGKQIPWIHLDMAGVGFIENDGLWAYKGATGFGVKSILNYLCKTIRKSTQN